MYYVNHLNSSELRELFVIFVGTTNIINFKIWTDFSSIVVSGKICKNGAIQEEYRCKLNDYNIISNIHSNTMQEDLENVGVFRKYMLKKFGEEYAVDYLLGDF